MTRAPGVAPRFDLIIDHIVRAKQQWAIGNHDAAERLLRLAGSLAIAESKERGTDDPVPE